MTLSGRIVSSHLEHRVVYTLCCQRVPSYSSSLSWNKSLGIEMSGLIVPY